MTAQILNIRDYQNKRDIQRLYEELAVAIAGAVEIENVEFVDTAPSEMGFPAWPCEPHYTPEKDPA